MFIKPAEVMVFLASTDMFVAWVRQGLALTLRPGDVVILDNLSMHKIRGMREAIEAGGQDRPSVHFQGRLQGLLF